MKKYLPLVVLGIGLLLFVGIFFLVRGKNNEEVVDEDAALIELPLDKRPVVSLSPSKLDKEGNYGHWLVMKIDKIEVDGAVTMDYELLYELGDGRTAGVPGTITLNGQKEIVRELLLGSESSGKFRYDEGVNQGTLTLKFRNDKGKLITKFSTSFSLLTETTDLSSPDGKFKVTLESLPKEEIFFVLMETFGVPQTPEGTVAAGPYGLFTSTDVPLAGSAQLESGKLLKWNGSSWTEEIGGDAFSSGIFVTISQ